VLIHYDSQFFGKAESMFKNSHYKERSDDLSAIASAKAKAISLPMGLASEQERSEPTNDGRSTGSIGKAPERY
jgi:hypothetical protein